MVARVGELAQLVRLVGVRLGVLDHLLDLVLVRPEPPSILICCSFAGAEILRRDVDDPVRVDVERDLDLRHAPRRRRDADELELAERLVVHRHLGLALEDVHLDRRLVVLGRREDLATCASGSSCCARSASLNTPPLVSIPSDSGVTSSSRTSLTSPFSTPPWIAAPTATTSSGLTPLCGSLPISSLTFACTAGMRVMPPTSTTWSIFDASRPGVGERLLRRADRALEQVVRELLELRARELQVEVLRARPASR